MLCIGRNKGETLIIGKPGDVLTEPIVITLIRHGGVVGGKMQSTRLGIEAQRDVAIVRSELIEQAQEGAAE